MTAPPATTHSSQWPSLLLSGPPARDFTWEPWQLSMADSFLQDIMERRLVHRTAPTRPVRRVSVQFTLRQTPSHTPPVTVSLFWALRFTRQTHPAIRALVFSSMREYLPWFSLESIEMKAVSG